MRLPCPVCGERDLREFTCKGAADALHRPDPDAGMDAWDSYMHLRDNPAGTAKELWFHRAGCFAWLVVTRNTVTHEVIGAELVSEARK